MRFFFCFMHININLCKSLDAQMTSFTHVTYDEHAWGIWLQHKHFGWSLCLTCINDWLSIWIKGLIWRGNQLKRNSLTNGECISSQMQILFISFSFFLVSLASIHLLLSKELWPLARNNEDTTWIYPQSFFFGSSHVY